VSTSSDNLVSDQLAAQIDLAEARLAALRSCLDGAVDDGTRRRLEARATGISDRCTALRTTVRHADVIPIGTPTAVEDLAATLDTLEADLDAAIQNESSLSMAAADRQARAWRGRTDRLRVQAALGIMEMKDDLERLVRRLKHVRAAVLVELRDAAGDARGGVEELRADMEAVIGDVRRAVDRAVDAIAGPMP